MATSDAPSCHDIFAAALRAFRHWWIAIVATHCFCGAFLCYAGVLYLWLENSGAVADSAVYSITVDSKYFRAIAWMYFWLAGVHGLSVVYLARCSVSARRLAFRQDPKKSSASKETKNRRFASSAQKLRTVSSQMLARIDRRRVLIRSHAWLSRWLSRGWRCLDALSSVFDIQSKYYGLVFLVREIVMTFIQSVQTYRLSCLVSRLWMNNVMASLLVLNCWATPLLQYAFRSRVGHVRLGGAIVNLLLDMASYIVLPTALLLPYAERIRSDTMSFDRTFWYTDALLISLINEVQLVFVASLYDALSKCAIAFSVARGLHSVTKLICTADAIVPSRRASVVAAESSTLIRASILRTRFTRTLTSIDLSGPRAMWWRMKVVDAGHHLLFVWGLVVLVAHVYALSLTRYNQCHLPTRPWFGTTPGCSLLEINCAVERTTGNSEDIDRILNNFDPRRIEYLVLRNCPLLQLPPRIQSLGGLLGLKIINSTILDWNEHAALTSTHHPKLRFLFVAASNMRELPIGLQSPHFPQTLRDVEFSRTNLSAIPDHLDAIWPHRMYLMLEECALQEVPPVVLRMRPHDLAIGRNNITRVPHELFDGPASLRMLMLDGNPLELASFPTTLATPPTIMVFGFMRTNIEALPDWMDEALIASSFVVVAGTPLCDRLIADGLASKDDSRTLAGRTGIDCSFLLGGESASLNVFPIDDEIDINPTYSLE